MPPQNDIGKLICLIYETENHNSDRVIIKDDFQIHKLYPEYGSTPFEKEIYPIYYYRDKKGNEILVNSKNDITIKLKNKKTLSFENAINSKEEENYLEETINKLKEKKLIKK